MQTISVSDDGVGFSPEGCSMELTQNPDGSSFIARANLGGLGKVCGYG